MRKLMLMTASLWLSACGNPCGPLAERCDSTTNCPPTLSAAAQICAKAGASVARLWTGSCGGYLVVVEQGIDSGTTYFYDAQTMALVGVHDHVVPTHGDSCSGVSGFTPPQNCAPTTPLCP
jgi:hypothetical protein